MSQLCFPVKTEPFLCRIPVYHSQNYGIQAFLCTEEIDILANKACVGRPVKIFLLLVQAFHPVIVGDIKQEYRGCLCKGLSDGFVPEVATQQMFQAVFLWEIKIYSLRVYT